jgi:arylsulfatase A-like enzyme
MRDRPNFLFICVDQMQASCLSAAGHPDVKTPNIDRLAENGIRFERAYCENPICTPSRLSILTGLSSRQHGVYGNGRLVPHTMKTMVSVLKEAGYRTHASGKLHLQPWDVEKCRRKRNGKKVPELFSSEDDILWREKVINNIPDGYFGFETADFVEGHGDYIGGHYIEWLETEHPEWAVPRNGMYRQKWRSEFAPDTVHPGSIGACYKMRLPAEIHYNTWIADRSIDFLESTEGPFFLWCSFPDPHHPFAAVEPYNIMYDPDSVILPQTWDHNIEESSSLHSIPQNIKGFPMKQFNEKGLRNILTQTYGMISHIDDCIGRVMDTLVRCGHRDNTIVVFIADHGEYLGSHHLVTKGPFPFEELMRVPFIWCDSEMQCAGRVEETLVSLLDIAPTVLERAGLGADLLCPEQHFIGRIVPWVSGMSLNQSILSDSKISKRSFLCSYEDHVLSEEECGSYLRLRCFYQDTYKLILSNKPGIHALYDLSVDPFELHDQWFEPQYAAIRSELLDAYRVHALETEYVGRGRVATA